MFGVGATVQCFYKILPFSPRSGCADSPDLGLDLFETRIARVAAPKVVVSLLKIVNLRVATRNEVLPASSGDVMLRGSKNGFAEELFTRRA